MNVSYGLAKTHFPGTPKLSKMKIFFFKEFFFCSSNSVSHKIDFKPV